MAVEGWTILEFFRKWVTCDEKDRNIEVRIIGKEGSLAIL